MFRWSGLYVGFLANGCLFDANGLYLGWQDEAGRIWNRNGTYMGEVVDEHYVMHRQGFAVPVPRPPRVPPVNPELPIAPANRAPRAPLPGWADSLDGIGLIPTEADLVGLWENPKDQIRLHEDLRYSIAADGSGEHRGTWMLRTNLMLTPDEPPSGSPPRLVFQIIAYTPESLTLRRITVDERSLPFTLSRYPGDR
jgi:hypothetical protein